MKRARCHVCGVLLDGRRHLRACRDLRAGRDRDYYVDLARRGYVFGDLTVEELEESVAHALAGFRLDTDGRVPSYGPLLWAEHLWPGDR